MFRLDDKGVLRCRSLDEFAWLEHGFQTRISNYLPSGFDHATLKQVHSAEVWEANGRSGVLGEGDALVCSTPGTLVSIRTADCIPALVADPSTRVVAAVHAGWRGVINRVIPATLERLISRFGCRPDAMRVAIGPCIRQHAFEVGPEVAEQFQELFPERADLNRRTSVDLAEAARRQFLAAGIREENYVDSGRCSHTEPELFHSFRRDREASGRMSAFIGIRF